jgi:hypothetical protein
MLAGATMLGIGRGRRPLARHHRFDTEHLALHAKSLDKSPDKSPRQNYRNAD